METLIIISVILIWILIFSWALIPKIKKDILQIKAGQNINHSKEIIIVLAKLTPLAAIVCKFSSVPWALAIALVLMMLMFQYNLLFDGLLNRGRGLDFFHVSKPDYASKSATERFFSQLPEWGVIAVKLFGTITSTVIYFVTSKFIL
jgi:hypothetical protein